MTSNIAGKSIDSAIKSLLTSEYKFLGGDKVQEMFVTDVLKFFWNEVNKLPITMAVSFFRNYNNNLYEHK